MFDALIGGAAKLFGSRMDHKAAEDLQNKNIALQKEFAQSGIQWKVSDALQAGVHPLAALGASTSSFSNVAGSTSSYADGLGEMGQGVGRAINATMNTGDRASAASKAAEAITLEKGTLENELLKTQIASETAKLKQGSMSPPMPIAQRYLLDGQGQTATGNLVKEKPMERTPADPSNPNREPGSITDVGFARTNSGHAPIPSENVKERIEDNLIQEVLWAFRNNVLPSFGVNKSPPGTDPGKGKYWSFNPFMQEYRSRPTYKSSKSLGGYLTGSGN